MAVQTAAPLKEQVDGGDVSDHSVEVEVKRLFDNLGGDHDPSLRSPPPSASLRAKLIGEFLFHSHAFRRDEPCVEEPGVVADQITGEMVGMLGPCDRTTDDQDCLLYTSDAADE